MHKRPTNDFDERPFEIARRVVAMALIGADPEAIYIYEWAHPKPTQVRKLLATYGSFSETGKPGRRGYSFRYEIGSAMHKVTLQLPDDIPCIAERRELRPGKPGFDQAAHQRVRQIAGDYFRDTMLRPWVAPPLPKPTELRSLEPEEDWRID